MEPRRLIPSASAPALAREDAPARAQSLRVERVVPPLALVPLDWLETQRRRRAAQETATKPCERRRRHRQDPGDGAHERDGDGGRQRLGERFLGLMALLARLRRMDLGGDESPRKHPRRRKPEPCVVATTQDKTTALERFLEKKRRGRADGSSPRRKLEPVVNAATAPLREHLTFEISMLLPPPMDTRQGALQSPIQRKKRKKRLRRRRRRRRPTGATIVDGKRTWQTSHVTWVPHASADYAQARVEQSEAARASSKLAAKFAALRRETRHEEKHPQRKYLLVDSGGERTKASERREGGRTQEVDSVQEHVNPQAHSLELESDDGESDEEAGVGGDAQAAHITSGEDGTRSSEESSDDEEDADQASALPALQPLHRSVNRPLPSLAVVRPLQTHQPAWISPELRVWLVQTGLFRTNATPGPAH